MESRTKRGIILALLWFIAGIVALILRVFTLSDLSQAAAFLFVGAGGTIFYWGIGSKLAPPELREALGFGIPENVEDRVHLFRRFYPRTMAELDSLPDTIRQEDFEEAALDFRFTMNHEKITQLAFLSENERSQMHALEGEVAHYVDEQLKRRLNPPAVQLSAGTDDRPPTMENQEWLKQISPRVYDFLNGIGTIETRRDLKRLESQLNLLIITHHMLSTHSSYEAMANRHAVEAIGLAVLTSKFKPKKRKWWELWS